MYKLILALCLLILSGCATKELKTAKDAKISYDYGMKLLKSGRYLQARETFQEIKDKLPDSRYATLAELRIADSFYEEESYPEAISSYEVFEELHPGHGEREYVIYRIAMSYVKDSPEDIDRDLEPSEKATKVFDRLLRLFPDTGYKKAALEEKKKAREKLMQKEYYIGFYYFKRGKYGSCLERYEIIHREYPDIKNDISEKAIYELWVAYGKLKDTKNQNRIKAIFKEEYPKSKFRLK